MEILYKAIIIGLFLVAFISLVAGIVPIPRPWRVVAFAALGASIGGLTLFLLLPLYWEQYFQIFSAAVRALRLEGIFAPLPNSIGLTWCLLLPLFTGMLPGGWVGWWLAKHWNRKDDETI